MTNISFADGFVVPSRKDKILALGEDGEELIKRVEFNVDGNYWNELPTPTHEDDWLAQYNEDPQSVSEWEKTFSKIKSRHKNEIQDFIYLIIINSENSSGDQNLRRNQIGAPIESLVDFVECFYYPKKVKLLNPIKIIDDDGKNKKSKKKNKIMVRYTPPKAKKGDYWEWDIKCRTAHRYDIHKTNKNERQLAVDDIINILSYILPEDAWCLCAITMEDLFEGNKDSFVSGMAAGRSHVGVFSFARYPLTHFDQLSASEKVVFAPESTSSNSKKRKHQISDEELFSAVLLRRSCKTLVHEIAHLLGIGHCIYFDCCMNGSGHLNEDFQQTIHLCPIDLHKVSKILGEDLLWQRYVKLYNFFIKNHMKGDASWIEAIFKQDNKLEILHSGIGCTK